MSRCCGGGQVVSVGPPPGPGNISIGTGYLQVDISGLSANSLGFFEPGNGGRPTAFSSTGGGEKFPLGGVKTTGYVIPQLNIPVTNTDSYSVAANNYVPATIAEIIETGPGDQGEVDYVKFAEKMQAEATNLANELQTLLNQKGVSGGGAGAGVPDGPDCDIDVDYPANTFTIEVKEKFQVVPCEDPTPCEFTCSDFTVTGDGTGTVQIFTGGGGNYCEVALDSAAQTVTLKNGVITLTLNGGTLSFAGVTAMNLPAVTTIDGKAIADKPWVTSNFSENTHTHTFSGSGSDGNTSITISGTTSGPST